MKINELEPTLDDLIQGYFAASEKRLPVNEMTKIDAIIAESIRVVLDECSRAGQ